ncbi:unnamed protein product [Microthlaspi erraticum]|uniref:Uncharacterized protein n=1 Tax=Microthlaspi erraticum TaxID=1685480 RepID=A0A6D2JBA6_9BRAS|nr:unnamed protein product [Microthlaspi erraticum]
MDFIKTTSLRALSELTFQRKWIGIIWMSRKGIMIKIAKTGPAALSRSRGRTKRNGRPSNIRPAVGQHPNAHPSRLNKVRAHVPIREASSRGRPNQNHAAEAAHDRTAQTGKHRLAAVRHNSCTAADRAVRPGRPRPTSGRILRPKSSVRPSPTNNAKTLGHDRPTVPIADHDSRPKVPTDRPNGPVDRSRF